MAPEQSIEHMLCDGKIVGNKLTKNYPVMIVIIILDGDICGEKEGYLKTRTVKIS